MINESNYHIYLDDFVAGRLSEELELAFVKFLDAHPGILDDEKSIESPDQALSDSFKAGLKKEIPIRVSEIDELLIASLEGDLNAEQQRGLDTLIRETPALQKERELFELTKLIPEPGIHYRNKSALKKHRGVLLYMEWAGGVAAAFLLAWMIFRPAGSPDQPVIAGNPIVPDQRTEEKSAVNPERERTPETIEFTEASGGQKIQPEDGPSIPEAPEELPKVPQPDRIDVRMVEWPKVNPSPEITPQLLAETYPASFGPGNAGRRITIWQWAYGQVKKRAGGDGIPIPENEIPRDALNLVLQKVSPAIEFKAEEDRKQLRIGGIEINRRSVGR